jgi:hypothetical protein
MYQSLLPLIGWAATLAVCLCAWWRGGPAERIGAVLIIVAAVAVWLAHNAMPEGPGGSALLIIDAFVAVGFLALAIRYASLWLGGAMLFQAAQFSLHAYYLVMEKPHDRFYAVANNLVTLAILLCIVAGTVIAWRARSRAQA